MKVVQYTHLLSACIDAALQASRIITSVVLASDNVIDKLNSGNMLDPQTEADVRAQHFIVESLTKHFPGIRTVGEENLDELDVQLKSRLIDKAVNLNLDLYTKALVPSSLDMLDLDKLLVFVDPLDGTKEYTLGFTDNVTTLIGISYQGMPLAGVISAPFSNQLVAGGYGLPFYTVNADFVAGIALSPQTSLQQSKFWSHFTQTNNEPITTQTNKVRLEECVAITTRSHWTPSLEEYIKKHNFKNVLKIGGCGNKALKLMQKNADIYIFPQYGTKRWDTCAVTVLLELVGGAVTTPSGSIYGYYTNENEYATWVQLCKSYGYTEVQLEQANELKKIYENTAGVIASADINVQKELIPQL